ncbi:conserved hypothetical protein, partial [Trichinella spiralis]|uniref:hypothetical protein n=1 Tax=Trichinella spiralis TaxID=6334 RepID=UPI0001EFE84B
TVSTLDLVLFDKYRDEGQCNMVKLKLWYRERSESTGLTPHKHTPNSTYGMSCLMDSVDYELTAGYTGPAIDTPGAFLTDRLTQSLPGRVDPEYSSKTCRFTL